MKINPYIKEMIPYSSKLLDVEILLNANETTNYLFKDGITLDYNIARYPIKSPIELTDNLASKLNLTSENIILGNGSTELLELSVKTFTTPGDTILSLDPSFTMYDVYSQMYGCTIKKVSINQSETSLFKELSNLNKTTNPALIFICNPNNPTGTILSKTRIESFLKETDAVVIVDEAYMEFADEIESVLSLINDYPNLLVARTFSKAYGLASLRLGYMVGSASIITDVSKAKLPYSLNEVTAQIGCRALEKEDIVKEFVKNTIIERERVYEAMLSLGINVEKSYTNFLYVTSPYPLQDILLQSNILIRNLQNNNYRITIGNSNENNALLKALEEVYNANINR